jgi:hypothetical protein
VSCEDGSDDQKQWGLFLRLPHNVIESKNKKKTRKKFNEAYFLAGSPIPSRTKNFEPLQKNGFEMQILNLK